MAQTLRPLTELCEALRFPKEVAGVYYERGKHHLETHSLFFLYFFRGHTNKTKIPFFPPKRENSKMSTTTSNWNFLQCVRPGSAFTYSIRFFWTSVMVKTACYRNLVIMTCCEKKNLTLFHIRRFCSLSPLPPLHPFSCGHFDQICALTSLTAAPDAWPLHLKFARLCKSLCRLMPQFMQIEFLPLRLEALKGRWALTFPANSYVSSHRLSHNCYTTVQQTERWRAISNFIMFHFLNFYFLKCHLQGGGVPFFFFYKKWVGKCGLCHNAAHAHDCPLL